ncbi:hypothetical protein KUH32_01560 [Thalassococcus sp. CAU 1522]|uniref:ABM domain-containing protein n=1 Tax=Thalassococcus arenae TaxID=2851652 RepID=A0ABS6N4D3_9RHOB|nr:hypothetical protein [Thalassococcus arenae]MBV2358449.1 hypothetical protein [Thalassococcus arenae]
MFHVTILAAEPRGWASHLTVLFQGLKLARLARSSHGCHRSGAFGKNGRVFVYAVWNSKFDAKFHQHSAEYKAIQQALQTRGCAPATHAFVCQTKPTQEQLAEMWSGAQYMMAA